MRVVTVSYQAITAGVQTLKQGNYVAKCELSLQPDNPLIDVSLRGAKSTYKYVASLRVTTLQYRTDLPKLLIIDTDNIFHITFIVVIVRALELKKGVNDF